MAARRGGNPRVSIQADQNVDKAVAGAQRSLSRLEKSAEHTSSRLHGFAASMGKGFAFAGAAAAGGLAIGLKKSADAAIDAEKAQALMVAQLKASGIAYKDHAKQIDEVIQKVSKLSGLDDEDLQRSFTNIVRTTGDVNKSLKLTGLAADFARAKHIEVAKAGEIVAKVAGGNTGILSRYGITIDKGASSTEALGKLQEKFAGQAEAYGKTTAGSLDRANVASENLGEIVGAKLTPLLAKGADALVALVDASGQLAGPIRTASGAVRNAYDAVRKAVSRFATNNREDIDQVIKAARNFGRFVKAIIEDVVIPVFKRLLPVVKSSLEGIIQVMRGVIRIITGIINGDWKQVWEGFKDIPLGIIKGIKGALTALWKALRDGVKALVPLAFKAAAAIGKAIVNGIVDGIKSVGKSVGDAISGLIPGSSGGRAAPGRGPFHAQGDGIGKQIGRQLLPDLGGFASGLHGADARMRPIASIASRFGLGITAGRTDHNKYTTSGNLSFHGSGEALDFSDGYATSHELSFARYMVNKFGGRIAELIHTPLGFSIKNGVRVPPIDAGAHYDHVHVALDLGRPGVGIGDGPGRRPGTGDGIGVAVDAARKAGFRGEALVRMVAIAGRESSYNPRAQNLKYPDHSIGLWQINQLAHHGRYGTDAQLKDPYVNARAAWEISGHGHNFSPWSTNRGLPQSFIDRARAAVGRRGPSSHPAPSVGTYKPSHSPKIGKVGLKPGRGGVGGGGSGGGSADDPNERLAEAIEESNRLAQMKIDLDTEIASNQSRLIYLATTQAPQVVGAVVAAVNGSIGGKVGLGFSGIRSPAGSVAGL